MLVYIVIARDILYFIPIDELSDEDLKAIIPLSLKVLYIAVVTDVIYLTYRTSLHYLIVYLSHSSIV